MFGEFFSHINTFKIFRPFFSLRRTLLEAIFFPIEYFFSTPFFLPSSLSFLVTHRCNLRCSCCFDKDYRNVADMAFADFAAFVDKFPKKYKPAIFFSGGEPFLHPDIFSFFKVCKDKGLPFGVVTNGMMLIEKWQQQLEQVMPDVMIFSVHGSKTVHDSVVGSEGAFDRLCGNIEYITQQQIKPKIVFNYIFNNDSYSAEDLTRFIYALAKRNIFPDDIRFNHLNYVLPQEDKAQSKCLAMNNFENVHYHLNKVGEPVINMSKTRLVAFKKVLDKYRNIYNFSFKPYLSDKEIVDWYGKPFSSKRRCVYPFKSLFFDYDGQAFFCQKIYFKSHNMKDSGIRKIWYSEEVKAFRKSLRFKLFPVCHRCCKL